MTTEYHVRISNDRLVFSAAHFITIGQETCERLHGHNYRVAAEVSGPLDDNRFVIDFIVLREAVENIIAALDHRVLLPAESKLIEVVAGQCSVEVAFRDRHWSFPRGDCVLLPVANTTAEQLANYIGRRLKDELQQRLGIHLPRLRIEVEECCGMIGACELLEE